MSLPVVVLLSGRGSNLQTLLDHAGPFEVVGVISNKASAAGLGRAEAAGVPAVCLPHKDYQGREQFEKSLAKAIDDFAPELIVLAGFMRVLGPDFVNRYQGRIINIHPSLLPLYRGLGTHQRALDAGDERHGASVHFVTAELDGGPVIAQTSLATRADDTAESLAARLLPLEHQLLATVVLWFAQGRIGYDNERATLDGEPLAGPIHLQF